jgi:hypothetical protein
MSSDKCPLEAVASFAVNGSFVRLSQLDDATNVCNADTWGQCQGVLLLVS